MLRQFLHRYNKRLKRYLLVTLLLASSLPTSLNAGVVASQTNRPHKELTGDSETARYPELPNFHTVNERLYRGAQPRAGGVKRLAALGSNTIINLRADDEGSRREEKEARAVGLRYFNIPFRRLGRPTDEQIEQVLAIINAPENGRVFIHCQHGSDRTGTVIAVYRIAHDGWTSEEAKREANRYGMKVWQRGMKDFISDYYRDHLKRTGALQFVKPEQSARQLNARRFN